ncbi:MAG: AAA family ATPase [Pseudomonadota bacterium]
MRLRRLDLIRYGRFSDHVIDLGSAPETDLTVIYGDNEAGKSTVFSAWLDLLFKIPQRTPFAFQFDRRDLVIGATLETASGALTLRRTGKRDGSLSDAAGHPVAESRVQALLHGLDRDGYRTRFCLDEAVLRDGGADIARARGDLGQLLHAGVSGLSGLSAALDQVQSDVECIHKRGGRATQLVTTKHNLKALDERIAEARLSPDRFDRLAADHERSAEHRRKAEAALADAQRRLTLWKTTAARREIAAELREIDTQLRDLPAGPDLPKEVLLRAHAIQGRREAAAHTAESARSTRARAVEKLAELPEDDADLEIASELDRLDASVLNDSEPLVGRAMTAAVDLPALRRSRTETKERIDEHKLQIAGPDSPLGDLLLPPNLRIALRRAVDAALAAGGRRADLEAQRQDAEDRLGAPVAEPIGLAELETALGAWQHDAREVARLAERAADAERLARDQCADLPSGWADLVLDGPPEEAELKALARRALEAATWRAHAAAALAEAEVGIAEATDGQEVVPPEPEISHHDVEESRERRDAAWTAHRRTLTAATADQFAAAMRADDALRETYWRAREARLASHRWDQDLERRLGEARRLRAAHSTAVDAAAAQDLNVQAAAEALGLPPTSSADALLPRRAALVAAADAARRASNASDDVRAAEAQLAQRTGALEAAMIAAGGTWPDGRDTLPAAAEVWRDTLRRRGEAFAAWTERSRQVKDLSARAADAKKAERQALSQVADLTDGSWYADKLPADLPQLLDRVSSLDALVTEAEALSVRIAELDAIVTRFELEAAPLARALNLPADRPGPLLAAARARAVAARASDHARRGLRAEIASADRAIQDAERDGAAAAGEIEGLFAGQAVSDLSIQVAMEQLDQRETVRRRRAELTDRDQALGGEAVPQDLEAWDPAGLAPLTDEIARREAERDAAHQDEGAARQALDAARAADGSAALDLLRATELETLADAVRDGFQRAIGLRAARRALRRYRVAQRGDMLRTAEQAFVHITGDAWQGLSVEPYGAGERLVGLRAGAPVPIERMSTGTQGQLYLALRVAGHRTFLSETGQLPFLTDDIHETFDDGRVRAALELSREMSRRGQVIILTHHRHLVDIARDLDPDTRVIDLFRRA